jgi:hypothetical protein
MIYLASPYNDPSPFIRAQRHLAALEATALLLIQRQWVYSPIVHCHEIARNHGLPTGHDFWLEYDFHILERCDRLLILNIPGWSKSLGVGEEMAFAKSRNIPMQLLRVVEGTLDYLPVL